jgi:cystathionine beta-lyase/cystathionine gamma-synthase
MSHISSLRGDPAAVQAGSSAEWIAHLERRRIAGPAIARHDWSAAGASTVAVHAGTLEDPVSGAVGTPIFQNSTFLLGPEQYRAIDQGFARDRFIYTRYGNPSQWAVQSKLAALESAESALVFSSGMGAIAATFMALLDRGAHVVASNELYGGTYSFLVQDLPTAGMSASFVDPRDPAAVEAAIRPETQLLFFEALTNPLLKLADVPALADIARRYQLRLVVDSTFVTPLGMKPLELGADVVVHSASKYLNGHSDLIAGAAAGSRKLMDQVWGRLLAYGAQLDPHACFLLERGLKTLALRMKAHETTAVRLALYLEAHPAIQRVFYPGLDSHPDRCLAQRLLRNTGGMLTFEVAGGDDAAERLVGMLEIPRQATSLGGVESLVSLPFNTSQAGFTRRQREAMGIRPGCVRLSVGIEDPEDLIRDFERALARIGATS